MWGEESPTVAPKDESTKGSTTLCNPRRTLLSFGKQKTESVSQANSEKLKQSLVTLMALELCQDSGRKGNDLNIFSLPRELRDAIWISIVAEDISLLSGQQSPDVYETPSKERQSLRIFNLLLVSRQVKREVTVVFRKSHVFIFQSSVVVIRLLNGGSYWGCGTGIPRCPQIFYEIGHLSVLPQRTVYCTRCWYRSPGWISQSGRKRALYCSSVHWECWRKVDAELEKLLRYIPNWFKGLRSLEIPAVLLLNISIVRGLRRLRGVSLHFAFVPESGPLEGLILQDGKHQNNLEWLAETAETDIMLPIYQTYQEIVPLAVAPLSSFAAAIRIEVASTNPPPSRPIGVSEAEIDPPLWIEFDSEHTITTKGLSPPLLGWYRYSARHPGVVCLEKAFERPTLSEPLERKLMKRRRQEMGRLCATYGPFFLDRAKERINQVDLPRAQVIKKMGIQGVIIKHEKVPQTRQ